MLGVVSRITPKCEDRDWVIVPNLWGGVIGRPGTLKTPAIAEGMAGLYRLEKEALAEYENERADYTRQIERFKVEQEAWRETAKRKRKRWKGF